MKNLTKRCSMLTAIVAATVLFSGVAPVALAADDAAGQGSVVATRSFPKVSAVKKNILAESTSTEVEQDSDWGGVESLDVPQTKSQAEKDAEERAAAEQQAREQAAAAAQQQASRSSDRSDLTTDNSSSSTSTVTVTPPDGTSVSSLLSFAGQFVGKCRTCPAATPRPAGTAPVSCSMCMGRWAFPCRITPVRRQPRAARSVASPKRNQEISSPIRSMPPSMSAMAWSSTHS